MAPGSELPAWNTWIACVTGALTVIYRTTELSSQDIAAKKGRKTALTFRLCGALSKWSSWPMCFTGSCVLPSLPLVLFRYLPSYLPAPSPHSGFWEQEVTILGTQLSLPSIGLCPLQFSFSPNSTQRGKRLWLQLLLVERASLGWCQSEKGGLLQSRILGPVQWSVVLYP